MDIRILSCITFLAFTFATTPCDAFETVEFEREVRLSSANYTDIEAAVGGGFFVLDGKQMRIERYDQNGKLLLTIGRKGSEPGQIRLASTIAVAHDNSVYVADVGQGRIHRFGSDGKFLSSFSAKGKTPGLITKPVAMTVGARGFLYLADAGSQTISRFTPEGVFLSAAPAGAKLIDLDAAPNGHIIAITAGAPPTGYDFALNRSGSIGGAPIGAEFSGFMVDARNDIVLVDSVKSRIIKRGQYAKAIATFGSKGSGRGQFNGPTRISGDDGNRLFVLDRRNKRVQVIRMGDEQGGEAANLAPLPSIRLQATVKLQPGIVDLALGQAQRLTLSKTSGRVIISGEETSVLGRTGELRKPEGLTRAPDGTIFVADTLNHRVTSFAPDATRYSFGSRGKDPGQFNSPADVAVNTKRQIFVADTGNHRIQVFTDQGIWLAEIGKASKTKKGQKPSAGTFSSPTSLAMAKNGQLFVLDRGNLRVQVFDQAGAFLRQIALPAFVTDPVDIALDDNDSLVVADAKSASIVIYRGDKVYFRFGFAASGPGNLRGLSAVAARGDTIEVADTAGRIKVFQWAQSQSKQVIAGTARTRFEQEYFVPIDSVNDQTAKGEHRDLAITRALATLAGQLGIDSAVLAKSVQIESDSVNRSGDGRITISVARTAPATKPQVMATKPVQKKEFELR